jgi:hypothetical protein
VEPASLCMHGSTRIGSRRLRDTFPSRFTPRLPSVGRAASVVPARHFIAHWPFARQDCLLSCR